VKSTSFVVLHPESISAEALAVSLGRFFGLVPLGTASTAAAGQPLADRSDTVIIHRDVLGADALARRTRERGGQVITLGEGADLVPDSFVPVDSSIAQLASSIRPSSEAAPEDRLARLTDRERQVLTLVAGGLSGKQVAKRLGISPKTVERHKTRIYGKLGVPNQAAAAGIAAVSNYRNGTSWSLSNI
jgi:DNA-binding CsgD family transcriptional regulator